MTPRIVDKARGAARLLGAEASGLDVPAVVDDDYIGQAYGTPTDAGPDQGGAPDWGHAGHQANGKTEELLTGDDAAKATAAAEAAVPDATPQRVETDADGDAYEVHMTRSDGSVVTVKLDSDFTVTSTGDGMG